METQMLLHEQCLCRLCGQETLNFIELYPSEDNPEDLSLLVNKYLPFEVKNDGKYPTKICPGCNIQLEATKSFMDLVLKGQETLRMLLKQQQDRLYRQEKQRKQLEDALKNVNPNSSVETYTIQTDEAGQKFVILQIHSQGPLFRPDHQLSLRSEGLERPRRKRGRPPKPQPEAVSDEKEISVEVTLPVENDPLLSTEKRKRKIKAPTRYLEAIQGKELDKVFKQQGVIDGDEYLSDEVDDDLDGEEGSKQVEEVIGRIENENGEDLGQQIIMNKNFGGRSRPKKKYTISNMTKKRRKFQCEICARDFFHQGRYEIHKKLHDVQFTCTTPDCGFKTTTKAALEEHQQTSGHSGLAATEDVKEIGKLELPVDVVVENQIEILEESKDEGSAAVPETSSPSSSSSTPKKSSKSYNCEECHKSYSCKQNYEVHMKAVHAKERPFECELCQRTFPYANTLKVHMLKHSIPNDLKGDPEVYNMFHCPECPKAFRHPSSLQYHRDSVHANGRRFVCNKCDKPFKHRQLLQRHQLVHSDERPFKCGQCDSAFKTKANYLHHCKTVHSGQKSHWCTQCGKTFAHQTALKLHQKWHLGVRPYKCDFCHKSFSQKGNLAEHRRTHTGEKPYACDHCGRAFTTSSQFRLHRKRHFDERPHKCEYCGKAFLHKVTLKSHMRRHFDDRPYKCQHCPKSFPEAWSLKKHGRMHTGEKPYKCEICDKAFSDSSNLSKHRRTHRNGKNEKKQEQEQQEEEEEQVEQLEQQELEQQEELEQQDQQEQTIFFSYPNSGENDEDETTTEVRNIYIDNQGEIVEPPAQLVEDIQLQQLIDQEGNPISFTGPDGQLIKVVSSSTEDGQENFQGLLPDGTLIPINLTTVDKDRPQEAEKINDLELLNPNIQFLADVEDEEGEKLPENIEFINEEDQGMCLVTTYNIEDAINPQYLTMP